jgi:hypothetical protein
VFAFSSHWKDIKKCRRFLLFVIATNQHVEDDDTLQAVDDGQKVQNDGFAGKERDDLDEPDGRHEDGEGGVEIESENGKIDREKSIVEFRSFLWFHLGISFSVISCSVWSSLLDDLLLWIV